MAASDFFSLYADDAKAVQAQSGLPASIILAASALESGYGDSGLVEKALNFFGIKAGSSWAGDKYFTPTREYDGSGNYYTTVAAFRSYDTAEASFSDYASFLKSNQRYAKVWETGDSNKIADELQKAGYATDPQYAAKLKGIIDKYDLKQYDDPSAAASNSAGKEDKSWSGFWNYFWDGQKEAWTNPTGNNSQAAADFETAVKEKTGLGWSESIGVTVVIVIILIFLGVFGYALIK